jgi:hypothetical protein
MTIPPESSPAQPDPHRSPHAEGAPRLQDTPPPGYADGDTVVLESPGWGQSTRRSRFDRLREGARTAARHRVAQLIAAGLLGALVGGGIVAAATDHDTDRAGYSHYEHHRHHHYDDGDDDD